MSTGEPVETPTGGGTTVVALAACVFAACAAALASAVGWIFVSVTLLPPLALDRSHLAPLSQVAPTLKTD